MMQRKAARSRLMEAGGLKDDISTVSGPQGSPVLSQTSNRSKAEDARFLIQATFGPTRQSLKELGQQSYKDWIAGQMSLPMESHRAYYRQRVNPKNSDGFVYRSWYKAEPVMAVASACTKGSRWYGFAFAKQDVGKPYRVDNGNILVDGNLRTAMQPPPLATPWWYRSGTSGYVCSVVEGVGADVQVAASADCRSPELLGNPIIWMPPGHSPAANLTLVRRGYATMGDAPPGCALDGLADAGGSVFVLSQGQHYRYAFRYELLQNEPASPTEQHHACVLPNAINEESCRVQIPEVTQDGQTQGLLMEVVSPSEIGKYLNDGAGGTLVGRFVAREVFFPFALVWRGLPPTLTRMAASLTGSLKVRQGGTYDFWLESDDGSRLTIGGHVVVDNGGLHGMTVRQGQLHLAAGSHPIRIDYFNGGVGGGLILSWKGPDVGIMRQVVPPSAFSTPFGGEPLAGCEASCGSPNEVSSHPAFGHQYPMFTEVTWTAVDRDLSHRHAGIMSTRHSKGSVWTMKALEGKDQLRQRTAWALYQIFHVHEDNSDEAFHTEQWLNYYDIFIRNAFGSFFDLLREVAYSPVMGRHGLYMHSASFASSGLQPSEKFAGDLLQLFTLGPEKLGSDGVPVVDARGEAVPTYAPADVATLAKVFTGLGSQNLRGNVEFAQHNNYIDPMSIHVHAHDLNPKIGLAGAYIGDGYPLCSDAPPGSFLAGGAKYRRVFLQAGEALELPPDSLLRLALCEVHPCGSAYAVTLRSKLRCTGSECAASAVRFVRAGGAYYEHVPSPCVRPYLGSPLPDETPAAHEPVPLSGRCSLASDGKIPGLFRLDSKAGDPHSAARRAECLGLCRGMGVYACQLAAGGCYGVLTHAPLTSVWHSGIVCWPDIIPTGKVGFAYRFAEVQAPGCPAGAEIKTLKECLEARRYLGHAWLPVVYATSPSHRWPSGCSLSSENLFWNWRSTGYGASGLRPICRLYVDVDSAGAVVPRPGDSFSVHWLDAPPRAGSHLAAVTTEAVFGEASALPASKAAARSQLSTGAYPPETHCSICEGEVLAYYGASGVMDADTVLEIDGRYFKNSRSLVALPGGARLRNPPVFLRAATDAGAGDAVAAEVDAALEQLVRHGNTAVFVARQLIQRFGISDPHESYVRAVALAFETGAYDSVSYGGSYGDLGATVAAILLHQGTRGIGAIREPLLKFVHLMRSMEYTDVDKGPVIFATLQDTIGQFPFTIPSVDSDHADWKEKLTPAPDFEPPRGKPEYPPGQAPPGAPPDAPGQDAADQPDFGPMYEVLTPPYLMGYLNGITYLIEHGVGDRCGADRGIGIHGLATYNGFTNYVCPAGRLAWTGAGTPDEVLEELDLLLTGGRLPSPTKRAVRDAAARAPPGRQLQATQQAVALTAEFNTLGEPFLQEGARPAPIRAHRRREESYKALVLLFLAGGADTWNLIMPETRCSLYTEYQKVRGSMALRQGQMLMVRTAGQPCNQFGVHKFLPLLRDLYNQQHAAFVTNIGGLAEPLTAESYRDGTAATCLNLFAHSEQQAGVQTLRCQEPGAAATGAGGRLADVLAAGSVAYNTASFSLSGRAVWPLGADTRRDILDEHGIDKFEGYEALLPYIMNISAQRHGNAYASAYDDELQNSIEFTQSLSAVIRGAQLRTHFPESTRLERELRQVARLIAAKGERSAERDLFFVSVGGFDTHTKQKAIMNAGFKELNAALQSFVAEMKAQGVWNQVVLASASEFGRTLEENGAGGTDHGWAGQHFVIGGSVRGGQMLNRYPDALDARNPLYIGRGRLIPQNPWESMLVPIFEWLGLEAPDRGYVFPNLWRFGSGEILQRSALFRN